MGFFSWLMGGKPPAKKGAAKKAAPAKPAAKAPAAQSREELIANALKIREEKKREFDKLDPEVRAKLLRQAMGKKDEEED